MDENGKRIQREIAKDKIQIILSSIAVAVLIIMELYIMINYKSNFMAMAVGILLMIIALFFLISGVLDMALKSKDIEEQKYEDIYNAQKASYLVIRKSFDELDQRLRSIEENSALPAEDIINAQKAVAKVTISRSKENTDALMNSNDELINQIIAIQEKLENNNNSIIEKQQSMLKETNFDIQQKIAELTSQLSSIEGRIQGGMSAMAAQPVQVVVPPVVAEAAAPESAPAPEMPIMEETPVAEEMPVMDEIPAAEEMPVMDEIPAAEEMPVMDEIPAAEEMPVMDEIPVAEEMPVMDEIPAEEETLVDDLGLDLDAVVEEEAPADDLGLDLDAVVEEEAPVDDLGLDLDAVVEEETPADDLLEIPDGEPVLDAAPAEESIVEETVEVPTEEPVVEEAVEVPAEEPAVEETVELPAEEPVVEEAVEVPAEEPVVEEAIELPAEEPPAEEVIELKEPTLEEAGADLDALLEEVGGPVEEEPAPEPEPVQEEKEENSDEVVIPDVGVDLTDPNRVMSAEEIEKLFASI